MDTSATDGEAHSDAKLDGDVRPKPQYIKQRSVQIIDPRPEIVEVREKHGPLYNAIPRMPLGLAVLCCLFNIVIPGVGTIISAFAALCGAPTIIKTRMKAFLLNLLSAFLQMMTFLVIVGWVWSILWGMNMVQMAMSHGEEKPTRIYCRRQSSILGTLAT